MRGSVPQRASDGPGLPRPGYRSGHRESALPIAHLRIRVVGEGDKALAWVDVQPSDHGPVVNAVQAAGRTTTNGSPACAAAAMCPL